MIEKELLEHLEKSYEAFMIPLRMGDGFNKKPFDEFCELVSDCADLWKKNDSIPKRAAMIFVDAFSAMTSSSYLYVDAKREQIDMAADKMNDLIRQCVE